MDYLRKNIVNILLFLLWVGMSVSLVMAQKGAGGLGDTQVVSQAQPEKGQSIASRRPGH